MIVVLIQVFPTVGDVAFISNTRRVLTAEAQRRGGGEEGYSSV
jgi:hypothetical protein